MIRAVAPDARKLVDEICSPGWTDKSRTLKIEGCSSVLVGTAGGREVVVKVTVASGILASLRRLLGLTRGLRQLHGAELLRSRGIAVAMPLALWRVRDADGVAECLVMEREQGRTLIDAASSRPTPLSVPEQHRLAFAAGQLVAAMCKAGVRNRDLKMSNVIVRPASPDSASGWELVQIDTVGVRDDASFDQAPEMLFRMLVECIGLGCVPRRALLRRAVAGALSALPREASRARAGQLWRQVEAIAQRHGDALPKVDPRSPAPQPEKPLS